MNIAHMEMLDYMIVNGTMPSILRFILFLICHTDNLYYVYLLGSLTAPFLIMENGILKRQAQLLYND